jgi:hypothetical protein
MALLQELRGAQDYNGDGLIVPLELRTYLYSTVPRLTNRQQNPSVVHVGAIDEENLPLSVIGEATGTVR